MKISHLKMLSAVGAATLAWSGMAQAQIVGASSDTTKVVVGTSNVDAGPHNPGLPGIAVPSMGLDQIVDLQFLYTLGPDANGVVTIDAPTGAPTDHSNLGVFHFAKVSGADVYFGEWSQTGSNSASDHAVYYVGSNPTTTANAPAAGVATYSVKGISDYANKGALSGTFTANFLSGFNGTLTGSLTNAASNYTVNIGTAAIAGGAISGASASATSGGSSVTGGTVNGRFYGAGAAALAGLVRFAGNAQYDTAFGGTKN
jgi:hypothetical protein